MKEMQANSVQHKVMIITVSHLFRNPVSLSLVNLAVSGDETGGVYTI